MKQWLYLTPKVQPVLVPLEHSALLPRVSSFASLDLPSRSNSHHHVSTKEIWHRLRCKLKGAVYLSLLCQDLRLYGTSSFLKGQNLNYKRNLHLLLTRLKDPNYDSNQSEALPNRCIILPNSLTKRVWNGLVVLMLLYTALIVPYRLAFSDDSDVNWQVAEVMIDGLFLIDVLLTCFTAVELSDGTVITSQKSILFRYFRTWMLLDILACVPFSVIDSSTSDSYNSGQNNMMRLVRLPRLYRLVRITRIYRLAARGKTAEMLERVQDCLEINRGVVKIGYFAVSVLMSLHVSGCVWYYIARLQELGPGTWVWRAGLVDSDDVSKYIASVYWACFSLTTVGYGDITGTTDLERLYSVLWMSFSMCVYSFTIGSLTSVLTSLNTRSKSIAIKLNAADQMVREGRLSPQLRLQIRRTIRLNSERAELDTGDKRLMFDALPKKLRYKVACAMYDNAVNRVVFFQSRSPEFIASVVPYLRYLFLEAGDFIYQINDDSDEIYIILKGRVAFLYPETDIIIKSMLQGTYFGDIEVILREKRRCTCQMEWEGELLVMSKSMMRKIYNDFPEVYKEMENLAKIRKVKFIESKQTVENVVFGLKNTESGDHFLHFSTK